MKGRVVSGNMLTLLLVGMLTLASNAQPAKAESTRLYVDPPTAYALPGESFAIDINVADVERLHTWQVNLSFNPEVLRFVNVSEGSFLRKGGRETVGMKHLDHAEAGWALFSWAILGKFGEDGTGTLANIEFRVLTKGESVLDLVTDPMPVGGTSTFLIRMNPPPVEPEDPPELEEIPFTATDGSFTSMPTLASVIYVNPPTVTANPGSYLTINVTIANVTDLQGWQFKLRWPYGLLEADARNITEGPFLKQGGSTAFAKKAYANYIDVACTLLGATTGVDGSGTLATIPFRILDTGSSALELSVTTLLDSTLAEISHTSQDGYFYTTWPVADFSYSPTEPQVDETVAFDASTSYDPDGTIVGYAWGFGDGTTGTDVVTTHSYTLEKNYIVTLQVTDDDGYVDNSTMMIITRAPLLAYISVPYHRQITGYYCGPAALEMVFDFYGPDILQREIADVARTVPDGTSTSDMIRAAHFSNLSISVGDQPGNITGYTARKLGYATFECWEMSIDQLKSLIAAGHPIIVLTTWHFRVAVGYSNTRITFQDSYYGENLSMTYEEFDKNWDYSSHWGLFVSPWKTEVCIPKDVTLGSVFNVTANVTYPLLPPFPTGQYPAELPTATVTLPAGLCLIQDETAKKAVSTSDLAAGASANVTWTVRADVLGTYTISVEVEGNIEGFVPPLPSDPEPCIYKDRIGGVSQSVVEVILRTPSPVETIHELIETIDTWSLLRGTKRSLTTRLECILHLLNIDNENMAVHKLTTFMKKVEALRGKKFSEEQADYLISEAQRIIDLING